jgi:hypothetical protein
VRRLRPENFLFIISKPRDKISRQHPVEMPIILYNFNALSLAGFALPKSLLTRRTNILTLKLPKGGETYLILFL